MWGGSEYADGQVVWSIVDGLRSGVGGNIESEADQEIVFDTHSRSTSYDSSKRESAANGPEDVFGNWGRNGSGSGTQALNLRHRDKSATRAVRPETDVSVGVTLGCERNLTMLFARCTSRPLRTSRI